MRGHIVGLTLCLCVGHVILMTLSNVLVNYPVSFFGFHSTWGAFTYPLIFILTDLTVRLIGPHVARRVIYCSMLPSLFISFVMTVFFTQGAGQVLALRISLACFVAYTIGQLLDIRVFQGFRQRSSWWLAPLMSSSLGNAIDTFLFFSIAFYQCDNPMLSAHWPEIALVDALIKNLTSVVAFIPLYGVVLRLWISKQNHVTFQQNFL